MQLCPKNHEYHNDMEVFSPKATDEQDKPTCPLCLFAVEQAQEKIKNDKSKVWCTPMYLENNITNNEI